jgi:hypothetical protein
MLNAVTSEGTTRGGGRGTRQSCNKMGVEALGNLTNQLNERGTTKGGGIMNGRGRSTGRRCDERERLRCWDMHIQCEDIQLRFSNTKSSILYNLVTVGEASQVILDKLLDNTTVKEYVVVRCEDLVVDSAVLH